MAALSGRPLTSVIPLGREDWVMQTFRVTMGSRAQNGGDYFRTHFDAIKSVFGVVQKGPATKKVRASIALTWTGAPTANDTITVNNRAYIVLADPSATIDAFDIGASVTLTAAAFVKTINATGVEGTDYVAGQQANADCFASAVAGVVTLTAFEPGEHGNRLKIAESMDNFTIAGSASVFTGGVGDGLSRHEAIYTWANINVNTKVNTIDGIVYTSETVPSVLYGVDVGTSAAETAGWFARAINGTYAAGEVFATTPAHPTCTAILDGATVRVIRKNAGGPALIIEEDETNGVWAPDAALGLQMAGGGVPAQVEMLYNATAIDGTDGDSDGQLAIICSHADAIIEFTVIGTRADQV